MICFSVATKDNQLCQHSDPVSLPAPPGYLASTIADLSGFGLPDCPWTLTVNPGKKIHIHLYNFAPNIMDNSLRRGACEICLYIREASHVTNITVCQGNVRYKEVYISQSSTIELHIPQAPAAAKIPRRFLIYYQGIFLPLN